MGTFLVASSIAFLTAEVSHLSTLISFSVSSSLYGEENVAHLKLHVVIRMRNSVSTWSAILFQPQPWAIRKSRVIPSLSKMTNAFHFDGLVVLVLLVICTCAYIKQVPRLREFFLSEKKGPFGALYKASVLGTRLHIFISLSCVIMAFYVLIF